MKKYLLTGCFLLVCLQASTQPPLSEQAQISLLTCSPSNKAAYTLYGHTAVRVQDRIRLDSATWRDIDLVFNYGIFDFTESNFIYRFTKGETDYSLACYPYDEFIVDYQMRGSEVYEQMLNLNYAEKNAFWKALLINALPENRVYRYNFFFDNCSTRPAKLLEQCLDGTILYEDTLASPGSFRQLINACTRRHPWLTFGCDLALGLPADGAASFRESFFLPEYLKNAFAHARILRPDGSTQPLASHEQILVEEIPDDDEATTVFTPLLCGILFFLAIAMITLFEWKRKRYFRALDIFLFLCAGIAGCVLFFLCFVSVHPCTWPNLALAWLHPFHLVGVILFAVKKLNQAAYCYHFINFVALLCMCFGWIVIAPYMNMAFIPLVLSFIIRSGYCFIRKLKQIG